MPDPIADDTLRSMPLYVAMLRLGAAMLCGGVIGWEREASARAAGLRTHMLIAVAAALFVIVGLELMDFNRLAGEGVSIEPDPLGLIGAVTSGVAFLGAGSIVIAGGNVRGVTTGASMWLCGAVGLCCGMGDVLLALMVTGMAVVVLLVIPLVLRPHLPGISAPPEEDEAGAEKGGD